MTQVIALSFSTIQAAVAKQFKAMSAHTLYMTGPQGEEESAVYRQQLWDVYLASFPAGANPIYKERTEHDCSCCRHFVKTLGGVVNIVNGRMVTLWDFEVDGPYQVVVNAMAAFVRRYPIENLFLHAEPVVGTAKNIQLLEDKKSTKVWEHFHVKLPGAAVAAKAAIGPKLSEARSTHDVLQRGLDEITEDAIRTTLELIAQGSLYRGEENAAVVQQFQKMKADYSALPGADPLQDCFVWDRVNLGALAKIRNTAIGTLLVDLSEGKDIEDAVKAFEKKVAPENYKRPTALVTKAMIANAQKTVDELGLTAALERRYATIDDITVPNTLFADRSARLAMRGVSVFDQMAAAVAVDTKKLGKVEEVPIFDFLTKIVPLAETIEVLFENRMAGNLVSLIAPVDPTANQLFKWPNGFSWAYAGDMADSIKEKVKAAGGNVTGDFRASLAWSNFDDLDLHLLQPGHAKQIYYGDRIDLTSGGSLDIDMNAGGPRSRTPVENIVFPIRSRMREGEYVLLVNQFSQRESKDVGFEVEMEFGGDVHSFSYPKVVKHGETIQVCRFDYSHAAGLKITESLPYTQATKTIWGLPTQTFHKVRMVMQSPNHWDGRQVGNKHLFFMLEGCRNDGVARGFFNEFLAESLTPHRKVLEMVGARMKTDKSELQLSGLGFSSTQRNSVLCRISGAFTRTVKVLL